MPNIPASVAKSILVHSIGAIDPAAAKVLVEEKHWRQEYWRYFVKAAQLAARSPGDTIAMAHAGLSTKFSL